MELGRKGDRDYSRERVVRCERGCGKDCEVRGEKRGKMGRMVRNSGAERKRKGKERRGYVRKCGMWG